MIEKFMPYLNYLNKNIFITDLDTVYKYSTNTLLISDTYEFNHYKEDLKYLIKETLENDGLYNYVLSNMSNNNYVYALHINLIKDNSIVGTLSLTKRTYAEAIQALMKNSFSSTAKMRASLLLSYVSLEYCYKVNSSLSTTLTFKSGNKCTIDNVTLLDLLTKDEEKVRSITSKLEYDTNTINLFLVSFIQTGVLRKYLFDGSEKIKEESLKKQDISELVITTFEQPKMMLTKSSQNEVFNYREKTYSKFELLFHVYKRMQELEYSAGSLAYIAQALGIDFEYQAGIVRVNYNEYNIEFSKERFRILTTSSTTRTKFYQLEEQIVNNILKNKTSETKLFNNIAYYKNYYLYDGISDRDKLITFLRMVSSIKTYRTDFNKYVKFLYKRILGTEDYKLYIITNNVRNSAMEKVIPITILKTKDTYYVVDPSKDVRVSNYTSINNYLEPKEYYSNLLDGKCDILC